MSYIHRIRSQVGHQKIFLAFTSVVLQDERGRVLLQRRTDFDVWGLPGGILEPGESLLDCARRELLEETGLTASDLRLVGVYTDPQWDTVYPNGDQVQQYTVCFQGALGGGQMQPDGLETSAQTFFEPGSLPLDQIPAYYIAMLQDASGDRQPAFSPPFTVLDPLPQMETLRQAAGADPLIAVGAAAAIRDAAGRLLMVKRAGDGGASDGGAITGEWGFPGGLMRLGENIAQTSVRETWEGTGYQVVPESILGIYSPIQVWMDPGGVQVQRVLTIFRARLTGEVRRDNPGETSELAWMAPQDIQQLTPHPMLKPLYQAVLDHLENGYFIL